MAGSVRSAYAPGMSPAVESLTVEANGLHFHVDACGQGDRLALCLHGFPESAFSFRHQLPLFARLGYRAWAPDMRGYGSSSRPRGVRAYAMDKLRADVAGLIEASGAKSVVLVGHDWGGGVAWNAAIAHVPRVERLIIMNAPHPRCFMRGLLRPAQLRRSWYMFWFQVPWLPEHFLRADGAAAISRVFVNAASDKARFPADVTRVYQDNALLPGALTAMLNYYRAMPLALADASSRHARVDIPTLLLWGEADTALTRELALETPRYVPDLTLRFLPGVSHWVQQEAPEQVNALIESWLAQPLRA
jgi:pimeloyl-ACP methyl ester carboxylesterase